MAAKRRRQARVTTTDERLATLEEQLTTLAEAVASIAKNVESLLETRSMARGVWIALAALGTIGTTVAGAIAWLWNSFKPPKL
jgi:hypothetical protein